MSASGYPQQAARKRSVFYYGWYIVAVGFVANVASSFSLASTLGIFLKPLTVDLGVSRGVFSLLRSGEGLIAAGMAPVVGSLVDRHGGRWLVVTGAVVATVGYLCLSQVDAFWQFLIIRWSVVTPGDAIMGSMVLNVVISRWFVRMRGRAIAFSSMGIGFGKIGMPLFAASLLVWLGWRHTWAVFGMLTFVLLVTPAIVYIRRSPEEMGLKPDGGTPEAPGPETQRPAALRMPASEDAVWTRQEAVRTRAFWLIVTVFGVSSIGVTGLNLHVFPYVSDLGHSDLVAAAVMSVIASTQLGSPLVWGFLAERIDVRWAAMAKFLIQAAGLAMAMSGGLTSLYAGFFLYGIGLGGSMVLPDVLWARFFGRVSLGKIRGLGYLMTHVMAAVGPPFFGFLFDYMGSYTLSFTIFVVILLVSAFLSLLIVAPRRSA